MRRVLPRRLGVYCSSAAARLAESAFGETAANGRGADDDDDATATCTVGSWAGSTDAG